MSVPSWIKIDAAYLQDVRNAEVDPSDVLAYFDGRPPNWGDIANQIPPGRAIVADLVASLSGKSSTARVGRMLLVLGPSAEGKLTVLMQVAHKLSQLDNAQVLWRSAGASLRLEDVANLPKGPRYFLVADDADEIAGSIYESVTKVPRTDVTFLLAARTIDWVAVGGPTWPWRSKVGFREVALRGLDADDAALIVQAWEALGHDGLRQLAAIEPSQRAERLVAATHDEAETTEGALLGGMLRVRYGEFLSDRIRSLLRALAGRRIGRQASLATALLHISAAHSAGIDLSPKVLAEILDIDSHVVVSEVILPLRDEAVVSAKTDSVSTRHRLIADSVLNVASDFNADLTETFASITRAAMRIGRHEFVPGYEGYTHLCRRLESVRPLAAVAAARAANEADPDNLVYIHDLSHVLRLADRWDEASHVCRQAARRMSELRSKPYGYRSFYFEWAAIEGAVGNRVASVWISAVSLSDQRGWDQPSLKQVELSLASIGSSLLRLAESKSQSDTVMLGVRAVETLSKRIDPSPRALGLFRKQREACDRSGVEMLPESSCIQVLSEAVKEVWENREHDFYGLLSGMTLSFNGTARVLGLSPRQPEI